MPATDSALLRRWRTTAISLAAFSLLLISAGVFLVSRAPRVVGATHPAGAASLELGALWNPFLHSNHHLIVAFPNPLFVRLQQEGFRDIVFHARGVNTWNEAAASREFAVLSRSLGDPKITPTFNLVERSTMLSTFVLSRVLAERLNDVSLARSTELSWQRLANHDVILLSSLDLDQGEGQAHFCPLFTVTAT